MTLLKGNNTTLLVVSIKMLNELPQRELLLEIIDLLKQIVEQKNNKELVDEEILFLNSRQVAEMLKISMTTLIKIETKGDISYKRVGREKRYLRSDIIDYISRN